MNLPSLATTARLLPLLGLLAAPIAVHAQSWYRDAVLAPMTQASFEKEPPKGVLKLGPVIVDVFAQGALEYSTNVLLAPVAEDGWTLSAGAGFDAVWTAAKAQQLKLRGELMQRHSLSGPTRNQTYFALEPGSALRYTAYFSDVRITPFINVSRQFDPIAAPTIGNTATFSQETYDAGIQADWNLRPELTLQVMGLRGYKATDSDTMERATDNRTLLGARLLRTFSSAFDGGVDYFHINQRYTNSPAEDSVQQSASLFVRWAFTQLTQLKGSVGVNRFEFGHSNLVGDAPRRTAGFYDLEFTQRLRPSLHYMLRWSQSMSESSTSNFYRSRELLLRPTLRVNERTSLHVEAGRLWVHESLLTGESGRRDVLGASLEQVLAGDLLLRLSVRDLRKTSTLATREYRQRTYELYLRKQF